MYPMFPQHLQIYIEIAQADSTINTYKFFFCSVGNMTVNLVLHFLVQYLYLEEEWITGGGTMMI